jgi:hypothetical protein
MQGEGRIKLHHWLEISEVIEKINWRTYNPAGIMKMIPLLIQNET